MMLDHTDPVHKVTIIPRGRAGGYTLSLPKEDRYYATRSEMLDELKLLLGGRVAEALVLNEISSGASNDLQRATELARQMICEYGMSDALGAVSFGRHQSQVFLGRDLGRDKDYSEEVAAQIDREIRKFIDEAYQGTVELLKNNLDKLHLIAEALIERETLEGLEVEQLMKYGKILPKEEPPTEPPTDTPAPIGPEPVAADEAVKVKSAQEVLQPVPENTEANPAQSITPKP
ncbi:MAG: cell division protein FtsH, partial [Acidaminococcaceae bacterium]